MSIEKTTPPEHFDLCRPEDERLILEIVLNNGGGAIFDFLPVAQVAGYRQLVRTDHELDFAHAAAQFRLPYRHCADVDALAAAVRLPGLTLVECALRGSDGVAAHRAALASAVA